MAMNVGVNLIRVLQTSGRLREAEKLSDDTMAISNRYAMTFDIERMAITAVRADLKHQIGEIDEAFDALAQNFMKYDTYSGLKQKLFYQFELL